ncbi:MAG: PEP-CTERM sorting domain-containing protein [Pirellulales bacterium]|nr:PEP-CTERM sorting domain-containing protein [Pirellulales bacterium]
MTKRILFFSTLAAVAIIALLAVAARADYLSNPINIDGSFKAEGEALAHAHHYEPDPYDYYHNGGGFASETGGCGYNGYYDSYISNSATYRSLSSAHTASTEAQASMNGYEPDNPDPIGSAGVDAQLAVTIDEYPNSPPGTATIQMEIFSEMDCLTGSDYVDATVTATVGSLDNPLHENLKVLAGEGGPLVSLKIEISAPGCEYWELEVGDQEWTIYTEPFEIPVTVTSGPIEIEQLTHFAFVCWDNIAMSDYDYTGHYYNGASVSLKVQEYVIPEPATLALLCSGLGSLLAFGLRRRR